MDSGEQRLKALGYKQELRRDFTLLSNTAISFSIISTLLGITGGMLPAPSIAEVANRRHISVIHVTEKPCFLWIEQGPCQLPTTMEAPQLQCGDGSPYPL
jgi:hypothetical protein